MKIANIVSASNLNVSKDFNVVNSMDNIIHGIPTLIVGFDVVNKLYPDFDIMEREIEPNLYWIFKRTERRDDFEAGLRWFINKIISDLSKEISYVFVDIMQYKKKTLCKIARKFLKMEKKFSVQINDMIYIYGENIIFGVDLKLFSFALLKTDKLKKTIQAKSTVFLGLDDILIEDKNIINELGIQIRYLPYLLSIRHE
jgi:tRNA(Ile)-lysidine synthase TilS/MesJ